jgi:hypothetical protein
MFRNSTLRPFPEFEQEQKVDKSELAENLKTYGKAVRRDGSTMEERKSEGRKI